MREYIHYNQNDSYASLTSQSYPTPYTAMKLCWHGFHGISQENFGRWRFSQTEGTFVPLPWDKPQQMQWVNSDQLWVNLDQVWVDPCWCIRPGKGLGYGVPCHWSWPLPVLICPLPPPAWAYLLQYVSINPPMHVERLWPFCWYTGCLQLYGCLRQPALTKHVFHWHCVQLRLGHTGEGGSHLKARHCLVEFRGHEIKQMMPLQDLPIGLVSAT